MSSSSKLKGWTQEHTRKSLGLKKLCVVSGAGLSIALDDDAKEWKDILSSANTYGHEVRVINQRDYEHNAEHITSTQGDLSVVAGNIREKLGKDGSNHFMIWARTSFQTGQAVQTDASAFKRARTLAMAEYMKDTNVRPSATQVYEAVMKMASDDSTLMTAKQRNARTLQAVLSYLHDNYASFATLNFDVILEQYLPLLTLRWCADDDDRLAWLATKGTTTDDRATHLMHLHGVYTDPDSMIFGSGDYREHQGRMDVNRHKNILRKIFEEKTLLLIGCGATFKDMHFKRVIAELQAEGALKHANHVFLYKVEDENDVPPNYPGVTVVPYEDHNKLGELLAELCGLPPPPPSQVSQVAAAPGSEMAIH